MKNEESKIVMSPDDKLKIAVQCIEANMQEFIYRRDRAKNLHATSVFSNHVQLCANAIKAIRE